MDEDFVLIQGQGSYAAGLHEIFGCKKCGQVVFDIELHKQFCIALDLEETIQKNIAEYNRMARESFADYRRQEDGS